MSIEPYHLGRYSSIGSRPDVRGAIQESDDLVNHNRVGGTFRGLTIQDELNFDSWWSSFYSGETEMAINVNGDEIGTLVNVNEKNPEDDDKIPRRGMAFSSELEAEEFCKKYAKRIGFTVRKGKVQRKANGTLKGRCFLCSCEGFGSRSIPTREQSIRDQKQEQVAMSRSKSNLTMDNGRSKLPLLQLKLKTETKLSQILRQLLQGFLRWLRIWSNLNTGESIWLQILTKYGDVTANCSFTAPQFVEIIKGSILQIVELMQKNTARSLSGADTYFIDRTLSDLERAQVKVDWLRSPFVGVQPLVEYAQAEGKKDVIRRRLNEKIAEVEQLYLELDQAEASLQELQHRIPDWLRIEDTLGKRLL
ncbi:hypothetical protein AAG906_017750 [Vitis piasezkii]